MSAITALGERFSALLLETPDTNDGKQQSGFLRRFGPGNPRTYHVFMSHLHWDHIMGFPFFTPVYLPGNRIVIHSCHADVEHAFRRQQAAPSFPVFSAVQ